MGSLDQIIDRATRGGTRARTIMATVSRPLTQEDILKLMQPGEIKPLELKAMRQSHHALARLIASGTSDIEAAAISGYSPSRVSVLKMDPQFQDLLAYYRGMEEESYRTARADMHARLAGLGFDSLEVLHERLIDAPEKFSVKELIAIIDTTADRTGYGKSSTVNANLSVGIAPETLSAIRNNVPAPPELSEENRLALLGMARDQTALPGAEEVAWIEGEGRLIREVGPDDDPAVDPNPSEGVD